MYDFVPPRYRFLRLGPVSLRNYRLKRFVVPVENIVKRLDVFKASSSENCIAMLGGETSIYKPEADNPFRGFLKDER
ncbi:hypothetical protein [Thioclava indica]|uniref:hypothetical protein n=1 Tax=Thioclava indica TaxID=1353528 RepID=UPI0012DCA37E|nr:hypothetical protein [Thioclava indica]